MNDGQPSRRETRSGQHAFRRIACCGLTLWLFVFCTNAPAAKLILKNGLELEGDLAPLGSMMPGAAGADSDDGGKLIEFVDNGLTRTYVSLHQVKQVIDNAGDVQQKIKVPQPIAEGGKQVLSLGPFALKPPPLDPFGRRTIRILLADGPVDIVQGVTLVTPRYYELRTLNVGQRLLLVQKYALSNLPSDVLARIMAYAMHDQKPEARKSVVQLYLESDRFGDAQRELTDLMTKHPEIEGLDSIQKQLRQLQANVVLDELKMRAKVGQHQLVRAMLEKFPTEGVNGETLFKVREMLKEYVEGEQQLDKLRAELKALLADVKETAARQKLAPLVEEICADLNYGSLPRLSAYRRLSSDPKMPPAEKLSLAVSGWLMGADNALNSFVHAQSLIDVRQYVRKYLNEPLKSERAEYLARIRSQSAGTPPLVAKLMSFMKPPLPLPETSGGVAGYYELTVPGRDKEVDTTYFVQLPPEYDPYRRYPVVLSLHGLTTDGPKQIDWWAGSVGKNGQRMGQASRQGYIIIAPNWTKAGQRKYEYSAREHALVLDVLRDSCRRFSIDTDQVFLSGHALGGDAAWDLALAHPDLWAGVIPIVATADTGKYTYCKLYWPNAHYVPFYFVGGEYDGPQRAKNSPLYDRYLRSLRFDATVVEYLGRGHESFSDEVVRIFEWMQKHHRNFFPKEFECATIRSFDNYFWWLEINGFPKSTVVDPEDWPGKGIRTLKITGNIRSSGGTTTVTATTGRGAATIWLSPELVDFNSRIRVKVIGRGPEVSNPPPDVGVILEDARTRGDRQHPFWTRVDFQ
ncbi:MAG: peptidase [Planctomycetia bacterium]|nr:peptidase [Planctomycetia bacterium]